VKSAILGFCSTICSKRKFTETKAGTNPMANFSITKKGLEAPQKAKSTKTVHQSASCSAKALTLNSRDDYF